MVEMYSERELKIARDVRERCAVLVEEMAQEMANDIAVMAMFIEITTAIRAMNLVELTRDRTGCVGRRNS